MKQLFFLALLALILPVNSLKGQHQEGFYMPMGFSYAYETVKDNSLSPVSYSGHFGGLHLGFYFQNEHWLSQLDLSGAGGFQYPDINREESLSRTTTGIARGSYSLSYRLIEINDWRLFAGLLSLNSFDYRNHNRYNNSQDNYAALFSAGPIFSLQRDLELFDKGFMFQYQLGLPVGTYYMRPSYTRPYFNSAVGNKSFAWWGDYYEISSQAALAWVFSNGNQLRLAYHWDFAQLNALNKVQLATHYLALTSAFKF